MTGKNRRSAKVWLGTFLSMTLLFAACTTPPAQPQPSGEARAAEKVLNIGATLEPTSLDPSRTSGAPIPFVLLYNVYETLIKVDANNQLQPLLAKSWDISPDRKTYTFHLADAKFSSGRPVNADAVVTNIMRIKNRTGGVVEGLSSQMAPVESATATDSKTVVVKLLEPSNNWLFNMSQTAGIIYDPAQFDHLKTEPAGSGPYIFQEWRKGETITLARNDNYWGSHAKVRGIVFRFYSDPNAMTTAMLSGQLDIISNLGTPEAISQFEGTQNYKVLEGRTNGEVVLGFNNSREPLKKIQVRQAINHAIDRKALLNAVWGGKGDLIGSMVTPLSPWYEDLANTYPYDPQKAKELLKEAGYESGLSLRLRVPPISYATGAGTYVVSQLKAVGINVTLEEIEWPLWLEQVHEKADYDLTIVAHVEPRDMDRFARPNYYFRYNSPAYQQLISQADKAAPEEETALLKQAARMLATDAPADWLWALPNLIITTAEVQGVVKDSTSLSFDLTNITIS